MNSAPPNLFVRSKIRLWCMPVIILILTVIASVQFGRPDGRKTASGGPSASISNPPMPEHRASDPGPPQSGAIPSQRRPDAEQHPAVPPGIVETPQVLASVSGTVRDHLGRPLAGVELVAGVPLVPGWPPEPVTGASLSDQDGYYFIDKIRPGVTNVRLMLGTDPRKAPRPQFAHLIPQPPVEIVLAPGEYRRGVDFNLAEGFVVEGFVQTPEGTPLGDVRVISEIHRSITWTSFDTVSDSEGRFVIGGLDDPDMIVRLHGKHPLYTQVSPVNSVHPENNPHRLIMAAPSARPLQVIDADGEVVRRFHWRPLVPRQGSWEPVSGNSAQLVEHPEGLFELKLKPREEVGVEVVAIGRSGEKIAAFRKISAFESTDTPVQVQLLPCGSVTGRILLEGTESPVPRVEVFTTARVAANSEDAVAVFDPLFDPTPAVTNGEGEFLLEGLIPRAHLLRIASELAMSRPDQALQKISSGHGAGPITIHLVSNGSLLIRVINHKGLPAAHAVVTHRQIVGGKPQTPNDHLTGTDGAVSIPDLPAGRHNATVTLNEPREMKLVRSRKIGPGERQEMLFDFTGLVDLSLHISKHGKPYTGGLHWVLGAPAAFGKGDEVRYVGLTRENDTGTFRALLAPGRYSVMAFPFAANLNPAKQVFGELVVEPSPLSQEKMLEVETVTVNLALVFPTNDSFVAGEVDLMTADDSPQGGGLILFRQRVTRPSVAINDVLPGKYQARFGSIDGRWRGNSGSFSVGPEEQSIVPIDVVPRKMAGKELSP